MKSLLLALLTFNAWASDPMFDQQWALKNKGQVIYRADGEILREEVIGTPGIDISWPGIEFLEAMGKGKKDVIVAVIDTGVDMTHPDLKGRLYTGKDFLDDAQMADDTGHGTHVAGIIAANLDGSGVQGVTPSQVKIMPLKVLNKDTNSFVYKGKVITDIIANAISYAIEAKVSVINMSLGWPQIINTPKIIRTLDAAASQGIVIVAASGNNNKDVPTWPCAHPAVICVGAIDNQGNLSEFSNHGGKVDLVAPGEWIVSTIPRALESRTLRMQGYEAKNGSSQAAPFVAAAAALLKLQNPEITVGEVKARLYASAKKMNKDPEHRFVRFGALSIKEALDAPTKALASVSVKNLVTVGIEADGSFKFTLPVEILGTSTALPEITISGIDAELALKDSILVISGKMDDLTVDSEIPVTFTTTLGEITTKTSATLSFARTLRTQDLMNVKVKGLPVNALIAAQGAMKSSRIGNISVEDKATHDFHGYITAKKENQIKVTTIRGSAQDSETMNTVILLEDHSQLLAVFEKDVNFDKVNDLVFYGMNAKRDHILLTFTDINGQPLYGANSRWELPISTFEGLPLKENEKADFSWIKTKTFFGEVLSPYYQKTWQMPDEDNSKKLLDHADASMDQHLYYWEPYVSEGKILARPRVTDSVLFTKNLKKTLNVSPRETLKVEFILPQTSVERLSGQVRHLVSSGDGFNRKFNLLTFSNIELFKVEDHSDQDIFQTGSNAFLSRSLEDFRPVDSSFEVSLLDRSNARVKPFLEGTAPESWNLQTSGWNNPFFEVVSTFASSERRVLFFESRYHVYVYDQSGTGTPIAQKLPINRDSSFPGVNFSETLQGVLIKDGSTHQPGVAVNSTLIYGSRLYTMVSAQETFTRPIALSVNIPSNCVPLKNQNLSSLENISSYALICQTGTEATLSFFPLAF